MSRDQRTKETLEETIAARTESGGLIISDMWEAYHRISEIEEMRFGYQTIENSKWFQAKMSTINIIIINIKYIHIIYLFSYI